MINELTNTHAPVSGGRGASAAADFAANKTLTMPDATDRVAIVAGNLYAVGDDSIGSASQTPTGSVSINSTSLSTAQLASHTHGFALNGQGAITITPSAEVVAGNGNEGYVNTTSTGSSSSHSHSGSFSGNSLSVLQPSIANSMASSVSFSVRIPSICSRVISSSLGM